MCELAGTGADPIVLVLAAVLALAGIVGGALLLRRRGRAGAAVLAIALVAAAALVAPPAPALAADCPPPAASEPAPESSAASLAFSPASVEIAIGETATATLTNEGDGDASGLRLTPSAAVAIDSTDCGPVLAAGALCTVVVSGATIGAGTVTAGAEGAADAVLDALVTGTTTLSALPASVLFPTAGPEGAQSVTITNTGSIVALNVFFTPDPRIFVISNDCPTGLMPGASCVLGLAASAVFPGAIAFAIAGTNTNTVLVTAAVAVG